MGRSLGEGEHPRYPTTGVRTNIRRRLYHFGNKNLEKKNKRVPKVFLVVGAAGLWGGGGELEEVFFQKKNDRNIHQGKIFINTDGVVHKLKPSHLRPN